ncbi:hypothetical protein ACQ86B_29210 (plasmid) [Mycolicibacterium aichiense]|uniref:hypothetical protein n=1 Tax=Mycolicibacterium aichiense TaxID=1799 RepID=UPI003D67D75B
MRVVLIALDVVAISLLLLRGGVTLFARLRWRAKNATPEGKAMNFAGALMLLGAALLILSLWTRPWIAACAAAVAGFAYLVTVGTQVRRREEELGWIREKEARLGRTPQNLPAPTEIRIALGECVFIIAIAALSMASA